MLRSIAFLSVTTVLLCGCDISASVQSCAYDAAGYLAQAERLRDDNRDLLGYATQNGDTEYAATLRAQEESFDTMIQAINACEDEEKIKQLSRETLATHQESLRLAANVAPPRP